MRHDEYLPVVPSPNSICFISEAPALFSAGAMDATSSSSSASSCRRSSHNNDLGHVFSPLASPPAGAPTVAMPATHYQPGAPTLACTPTTFCQAGSHPQILFGQPTMLTAYSASAPQLASQQLIPLLPAQYRLQQAALTPQGTPPMLLKSPVASAAVTTAGGAGMMLSPEHGAMMSLGYANGMAPATQLRYGNGAVTATAVTAPMLVQPILSMSGEHHRQYIQLPMATTGAMRQPMIRTPDSDYRDAAAVVAGSNGFLGTGDGISDVQAVGRERRLYGNPSCDPTTVSLASGRHSFYCSVCKLNFLYRRELEQHFMQHRGLQRPVLCHVCGKCFPRADHVNRHAASKHTAVNHACQLCDAEFGRAYNLHKHWKEAHPACVGPITNDRATATGSTSATDDEQKSDSQLDDVDVVAVSPTTMTSPPPPVQAMISQRRSRVVDSQATACGGSGDGVASPTTASEQRPMTASSSVVRRGVRGAPNLPRRYACEKCRRCFARSAHLLRHRRIHTGEKPFTCFKCFRIYARGDYLRTHLTTQHNRTAMDCEVCLESYDTINKLLEHMKTRHGRAKPWFLQRSDKADGGHLATSADSADAAGGDQDADAWSTCGDVDQQELGAHTTMQDNEDEENEEEAEEGDEGEGDEEETNDSFSDNEDL